jgi:transcription antitermination factor NusG
MLDHNNQVEWFAVHTRHQHERTVSSVLGMKKFQTFLPTYRETRRWSDRRKAVSVPLFPGYLFVNDARTRRMEILSAPGVSGIVSVQGVPAVIPHEEMEAVMRMTACAENLRRHPFLKHGDLVEVIAGPLSGVRGALVLEKDECRLVISIQMLGRSAAVTIERTYVVAVSRNAELARKPETAQLDITKTPTPGYISRPA